MNTAVRDFMNPKLVYLPEGTRPEVARKYILDFGITAVPVVDDDHKPVGVVSLRDLADTRMTETPVSEPAQTIGIDESIPSAAAALARGNVHHLVVVDTDGRAAGMISALDVIRGLLGLTARHPEPLSSFKR